MKRKYKILVSVIAVCWIVAQFVRPMPGGSSYSPEPTGTMALYTLLEERGYAPQRWRTPFSELDPEQLGGLMVVTTPSRDAGSMKDLLEWIERGNSLLVVGYSGLRALKLFAELGLSAASDVERTLSHIALDTPDPASVECTHPVCTGVSSISELSSMLHVSQNVRQETEVLVGNAEEAQVLRITRGAGEIWVFSSRDSIINRNIDRLDNLRLIYQIIYQSTQVYFDEFHHGYTAPVKAEFENRWETMMLLLVYLAVILALIALSRSVRFGTPIIPSDGKQSIINPALSV